MDGLYRDILLDHYKNSPHKITLENADITAQATNAACGDMVNMQVRFDGMQISQVGFSGAGCVISQASSSLLCGHIQGKRADFIQTVNAQFIVNMLQIDIGPVRLKCALLPLQALQAGLAEYKLSKGQ